MLKRITLVLIPIFLLASLFFSNPFLVNATCSPAIISPSLSGKPGTKAGQAILTWNTVPNARVYHVVYGYPQFPVMFGSLNIGANMTQPMITIEQLERGKTYNFQIWASCNENEGTVSSNWVTIKAP
jgi:hypothetical protein